MPCLWRPPDNPVHYMGRDFMFSTGDILQQYIAPIIYRPDPDGNLFVGISAPGLLGCFTAMNAKGVAIGVDMSPAGNCDEDQPGLNSLLLNRDAIQNGNDLQGAIKRIVDAPRGVSWIHMWPTDRRTTIVPALSRQANDMKITKTVISGAACWTIHPLKLCIPWISRGAFRTWMEFGTRS